MKPQQIPSPILLSVNRTRWVGAIFNPNSQTLAIESGRGLTDTFDLDHRHDFVTHYAVRSMMGVTR